MHIGFEPVGTMAVPNLEWALNIVQKLNLPEVGLVIDDFNLYLWDLLSDVDLICTIPPEKSMVKKTMKLKNFLPGSSFMDSG